ncbi:MAG: vitamin K epoxide reductase family protein [Bellilinea sp.]|jgi:uncharacterized membrane protein
MTTLRKIAIAAAVLGIIDSIYLYIIKITNNKALCIQGVGDCWSVNTSIYSEAFGIPVSILGLLMYAAIAVLWIMLPANPFYKRYAPILNFGLSLVGVIFSAYLTYLEIAVIKAICPFCVLSAILVLILFVVSLIQLFQKPGEE